MTTHAPNIKAVLACVREGLQVRVPLLAFPGETAIVRKSRANVFVHSVRNQAHRCKLGPVSARVVLEGCAWTLVLARMGGAA